MYECMYVCMMYMYVCHITELKTSFTKKWTLSCTQIHSYVMYDVCIKHMNLLYHVCTHLSIEGIIYLLFYFCTCT